MEEEKKKIIGIVGAGVSGLVTCKHVLQRGFRPVVFESENNAGGLWAHTFGSTRLQSMRQHYEFTDFPWPSDVNETFPDSAQVMDYVFSYASRFDLYRHISFGTKVVGVDYVGEPGREQMDWDQWSATGGEGGKWEISVQRSGHHKTEVHVVDFLILCIGRFSQVPNIPSFATVKGAEEFKGQIIHSMDYSNMKNAAAAQLIRGKRIAIVGFQKSGIDLANECANANGVEYPCTVVRRSEVWTYPSESMWGYMIFFVFFTRFVELMVHKPGEGKLLSILVALLLPLKWVISKMMEIYIRWHLPLKKYDILPVQGFFEAMTSCGLVMMPSSYCEKLKKGSIVLKKSQSLGLCEDGLVIDNEVEPLKVDLVILCTGYSGDDKLKQIFSSSRLRQLVNTSSLYRGCIHPRIPQLAIMGYLESTSVLATTEMRCKWLSHLIAGRFELPSVADMEEDVKELEKYERQHAGSNYKAGCVGLLHIWKYDQLCRDMGCNPRRKKSFLAEWFSPYMPSDYKDV